MKGYIIVNCFVNSIKFKELYEFFIKSANRLNVSLEIKTTADMLCTLDDDFKVIYIPDFVIFWDKDIYLARRLEAIGVHVFNGSKAIEYCDNKILTSLALNGNVNIPKTVIVPKTFEGVGYNDFKFLEKAIASLGLPIIIKEAYGSFGQQVYLANTFEEGKAIFEKIKFKDCIIQEFIASSKGKDVRINVVGDKVVASMLRFNDNDFRSNITNGGSMKPYSPSESQKEIALKACRTLGLDFAGVDVLFGENDIPYVCEVNSNPHFKSTYECTGVDISEIILKHILNTLNK